MSSSVNQPFLAAIQLFVDSSKQDMDEVVRRTGIKILGRLVEMSPIGNPDLWQVNQTASAYNTAVREHNAALRQDPANLTKAGRLKYGRAVNDSMDIKKPEGYVGGRFKNNWYVGFDSQPTQSNDTPDASGQGSNSVAWRCLRYSEWARSARFTSPITCHMRQRWKTVIPPRRRAGWWALQLSTRRSCSERQ